LSETVSRKDQSRIQESVDAVQAWATSNMAELNEEKCKELRIDFSREPTENTSLHPVLINHKEIEVVSYAKTLGLTVSNDFKWKMHINNIISKASKCLHLITQLKKLINNSRGKYKRNECLINVCKSDTDLS
jgi:hypothetical protein